MEEIKVTDKRVMSPISGKKTAFEEEFAGMKSWLCLGSGYSATSKNEIDSEYLAKFEANMPSIVRELRFDDKDTNIAWYPGVLNTARGMIYPIGTKEDWKWAVTPMVEIPKEDQPKFPIEGKEGEFHKIRLADEATEYFDRDKYQHAIEFLGIIINLNNIKDN